MNQRNETATVTDMGDRAKVQALPWAVTSGMLNCVFTLWTFGGSVFVLFLNELGLPKGKIGVLLSLFPFCGLLALGFAPIAALLGRKRIFLAGYGIRKFVMALLLLLPWVTTRFGQFSALWFLGGIIIVFAVARALAETAYYAWVQEFVPNWVRGRYSSWATVTGMVTSGVALAIASWILATIKGVNGYLLLIGTGSALGLVGVLLHAKVPGGKPIPKSPAEGSHWRNMMAALSYGNFKSYLGGMAGLTLGSTMLIAFLPLYLKERIGLESTTVLRLDIVAMVGGALASVFWGWLSDKVGSRPVLMPACFLSLLAPVGWLLLPASALGLVPICALYFLTGIAANGVVIGSGRLLFNGVVPSERSTVYTSVYYAWLGLTGGIAPLLAGGVLTWAGDRQINWLWLTVDGFALMFGVAILCLVTGGLLYGRVRPDDKYTTRTALKSLLNRVAQR